MGTWVLEGHMGVGVVREGDQRSSPACFLKCQAHRPGSETSVGTMALLRSANRCWVSRSLQLNHIFAIWVKPLVIKMLPTCSSLQILLYPSRINPWIAHLGFPVYSCVVPGPAASSWSGSLWEMQHLRSFLRHPESGSLCSPGDSDIS